MKLNFYHCHIWITRELKIGIVHTKVGQLPGFYQLPIIHVLFLSMLSCHDHFTPAVSEIESTNCFVKSETFVNCTEVIVNNTLSLIDRLQQQTFIHQKLIA